MGLSSANQASIRLDTVSADISLAALLKAVGLSSSHGEAHRLIDGGGIKIDGVVVSDKSLRLRGGSYTLQVGKRKFVKANLI